MTKALSFIDNLTDKSLIAATEISWFTEERPKEIHNFWMDSYPEIDTIHRQVAKIYKAGYLPIEEELYSKYKDFYGYTFLLQKKLWQRVLF